MGGVQEKNQQIWSFAFIIQSFDNGASHWETTMKTDLALWKTVWISDGVVTELTQLCRALGIVLGCYERQHSR